MRVWKGAEKMTIKIDKKSLRDAVTKARLPEDMDRVEIERTVERDVIDAIRSKGMKNGIYRVSLGDFNYDVIMGKDGKRRYKRIRKS